MPSFPPAPGAPAPGAPAPDRTAATPTRPDAAAPAPSPRLGRRQWLTGVAALAGLAGLSGLAAPATMGPLAGGPGGGRLGGRRPTLVAQALADSPAGDPATTMTTARAAVVYGRSRAGKLDKGFNQMAAEGVQLARDILGVQVLEFEPRSLQDEAAMVNQAASLAGLVITVGYGLHLEARNAAHVHPSTRFAVIDAEVAHPRFQSLVFREQEGSFLAGLLAALTTRTGVLGFIGGMPSPVIRRFRAGFIAGARHGRPDIRIKDSTLGVTGDAFHNPFKGLLAAEDVIADGADILFAAAGRSGLGVYQAAADHGVLAIGVDANQNFLFPGTMLTSMIKRVDTAVFMTIQSDVAETWAPQTLSLGLKEDGVGLAIDHYNQSLIPGEVWARVIATRKDLIAGTLDIPPNPTL